MDKHWVSQKEAAAMLGVNQSTASKLARRHNLRLVSEGSIVYHYVPEILELRRKREGRPLIELPPAAPPEWLAQMVAQDDALGLQLCTRAAYANARLKEIEADESAGLLIRVELVEAAERAAIAALRDVISPEALGMAYGWDSVAVSGLRATANDQVLMAWRLALDG